jgi:hypothetical protein
LGLGGDLIYSAAIREIKEDYPSDQIYLFDKNEMPWAPRLLSKILGKPRFSFNPSPVFKHNPHLSQGLISRDNSVVIDASDPSVSYVEDVLADKVIWKTGKHAVEIICENFGVKPRNLKPSIFFEQEERESFYLKTQHIPDRFIAVEPNGKTEFFSENRLWWFERWQQMVDELSRFVPVVQVGDGSGSILQKTLNMNGSLTFRETGMLLESSLGFVGTIGGLMHLARAVDAPSIILFSGAEPIELCGYPENTNWQISVPCSPCGLRIKCPKGRFCMDHSVADVLEKVIDRFRI